MPNLILDRNGLLTAKNIKAEGGELKNLAIRGLLTFPALGGNYYINGVSDQDDEVKNDDGFTTIYDSLINLPGFSILNPLYYPGSSYFRVYIKGKICFQIDETN